MRCGAADSLIWEWYHELPKNQRLFRVREQLLQLGEEIPDSATPNYRFHLNRGSRDFIGDPNIESEP